MAICLKISEVTAFRSELEGLLESVQEDTREAQLEAAKTGKVIDFSAERKVIEQCEAALARIDSGSYGICENCGEDIELSHLKADPLARFCISCKGLAEP